MKESFAQATPEAGEQAAKETFQAIADGLAKEGITFSYLAKKLKKELNAKETETYKGKTLVPKDPKDVASELIEVDTVIYSKPLVAWDIRQKARQDAHKLRGDYPAEKRELAGSGGDPIKVTVVYDEGGNGAKGPSSKSE